MPRSQHDQAVAALVTCFSSKRGVLQLPLSPIGFGPTAPKHTLFPWLVVEQRGKQVGDTLTSKAVT